MSRCAQPGSEAAQVCCWTPDSAVVSVWRAQEYCFNKYLMKEEVLSIHYTVSNMWMRSLGCLWVSVFNILCLQWRVTYGETHEYGAGSLRSSLSFAQMLALYSARTHTYLTCIHTHAHSLSLNENNWSKFGDMHTFPWLIEGFHCYVLLFAGKIKPHCVSYRMYAWLQSPPDS